MLRMHLPPHQLLQRCFSWQGANCWWIQWAWNHAMTNKCWKGTQQSSPPREPSSSPCRGEVRTVRENKPRGLKKYKEIAASFLACLPQATNTAVVLLQSCSSHNDPRLPSAQTEETRCLFSPWLCGLWHPASSHRLRSRWLRTGWPEVAFWCQASPHYYILTTVYYLGPQLALRSGVFSKPFNVHVWLQWQNSMFWALFPSVAIHTMVILLHTYYYTLTTRYLIGRSYGGIHVRQSQAPACRTLTSLMDTTAQASELCFRTVTNFRTWNSKSFDFDRLSPQGEAPKAPRYLISGYLF